jgi:septum formation protein
MKLILASASPRRRELLAAAGFTFTVQTADIDESQRAGEDPITYTTRLALEKAQAIFNALPEKEGIIVLGADTTVALDDTMLGKPVDVEDAQRMLHALSGRAHSVTTGIAVISSAKSCTHAETTKVFFEPMTEDEIAKYVATGEPLDKAGAYGIQGRASRWISRIEGDYSNVVGLPIAVTCKLLERMTAC